MRVATCCELTAIYTGELNIRCANAAQITSFGTRYLFAEMFPLCRDGAGRSVLETLCFRCDITFSTTYLLVTSWRFRRRIDTSWTYSVSDNI